MALLISHLSLRTRIGQVWLGATQKGLFCLNIGDVDSEALKSLVGRRNDLVFEEGGDMIVKTAQELVRYLEGKQRAFSVPLDLRGYSPFARKVWRATCKIPFGQVRTYAWVADRIKQAQAARAVGGALATNPIPIIIPCHRVVGSHGSLGGYTGGVFFKRFLLELEAGQSRLIL